MICRTDGLCGNEASQPGVRLGGRFTPPLHGGRQRMPLLDAYIPEGALSREAERDLVARVTDLLIEHEGVDPTNPVARRMAWVFVHRPEIYVGGRPPKSPRYRFLCRVPEGQYNPERRAALTAEITRAVAKAEDGAYPHPEVRVTVLAYEVPEGWWVAGGRTV